MRPFSRPTWVTRPLGNSNLSRVSASPRIERWPSCRLRWCALHRQARLLGVCGPPRENGTRWWMSTCSRFVQLGTVQRRRSRCSTTRRVAGGNVCHPPARRWRLGSWPVWRDFGAPGEGPPRRRVVARASARQTAGRAEARQRAGAGLNAVARNRFLPPSRSTSAPQAAPRSLWAGPRQRGRRRASRRGPRRSSAVSCGRSADSPDRRTRPRRSSLVKADLSAETPVAGCRQLELAS